MVFAFTSETFTPPEVTMASSTGALQAMGTEKHWIVSSSARRCCLVMELTFCRGSIPLRAMTAGIIDRGSSAERLFSKSRFCAAEKSRRMRASSFFSSSAGLRSIRTV